MLRDIEDIINDDKAEFRDFDDSEDDWKILHTGITNGCKKNHTFKTRVINSCSDEIDEDKIIYISWINGNSPKYKSSEDNYWYKFLQKNISNKTKCFVIERLENGFSIKSISAMLIKYLLPHNYQLT